MSISHLNVANTTSPSRSIAVHFPPDTDLTLPELQSFPAFKIWLTTLERSLKLQHTNSTHPFHAAPYTLRSLTIQARDRFGSAPTARLGFVKLAADVRSDADAATGAALPGSIFLRGAAVAMLVLLQPDDVPEGAETDKHVLLTVQARVPAGSLAFVELPAGMLDDQGSFAGAAAREIDEELGLRIGERELVDLTALALAAQRQASGEEPGLAESLHDAVYTSAGGQDEAIAVFLHERRVPREQLRQWTGKLTGLRESGEKITLKCVPFDELWKVAARDAKALAALALYDGLKREKLI